MSGPDRITETSHTIRYESTLTAPFALPDSVGLFNITIPSVPADVVLPASYASVEAAFPSHLRSRANLFTTKNWQFWAYGEQSKKTENPYDTSQPVTGVGVGVSYKIAGGLAIGVITGASRYVFPQGNGISSETVPSFGICVNCLLSRE